MFLSCDAGIPHGYQVMKHFCSYFFLSNAPIMRSAVCVTVLVSALSPRTSLEKMWFDTQQNYATTGVRLRADGRRCKILQQNNLQREMKMSPEQT